MCHFAAISPGWGDHGLGSSSVEAHELAFAMPPVQHPARALGPGLPPGMLALHKHQLQQGEQSSQWAGPQRGSGT